MSNPDPCRACGSVERWHLADGTERCPVCHPDPRGEMAENVGIERRGSDEKHNE